MAGSERVPRRGLSPSGPVRRRPSPGSCGRDVEGSRPRGDHVNAPALVAWKPPAVAPAKSPIDKPAVAPSNTPAKSPADAPNKSPAVAPADAHDDADDAHDERGRMIACYESESDVGQ